MRQSSLRRWLVRGASFAVGHRGTSLRSATALLLVGCHHVPAAMPNANSEAGQCPSRVVDARPRTGFTEADSSLTETRVRWAVADLLAALNSRDVADFAVRYDWTGNARQREEFFARVSGPVAATRLAMDAAGAWWSDAPGRKQQAICLSLSIQGNNAGGVAWTHKVALRANVLDDGRAAWLSRMQVVGQSP